MPSSTMTSIHSSPSLTSLASTSTAVSTTPICSPKPKDSESESGRVGSHLSTYPGAPRSKPQSWLKRALGATHSGSGSSPAPKMKPPMTEEERRKDVARRAREAELAKFTAKYGFSGGAGPIR
ncbi:uncharacterized protein BXZ73DRAFT_104533 [Epithele typhae]|uniref:uncharacterized protein n=1 Tax=Epithele typhae TaxID=378194 RepID=UPI0020085CA9|nr:uncharacterized protein BXZ73DRAFT_104533 [Epithele typhae]KAH9921243.1 hypothetical protein BXZ73DRAFT_104533 [Epithele typhae]